MHHIPHMVSPDTSTLQWSSNLRTHLINTIAHITHPATVTDMGGPPTESDTTLEGCTPAPVHSRPSTNVDTITKETKHTPAPPPSSSPPLITHTPPANRGRKRSTPTPDEDGRARGTRRHKVRDTTTGDHQHTQPRAPTHHTVARDCVPDLHWEGERNDQCEACDQGGVLTECTRCNIVWHASCLAPPLPFPLRPQDEIVCSEECWNELVQATLTAGGTEPQREDPKTSRKFLLCTPKHTSTRPTLYPTISPMPHTQVLVHSTRDPASHVSDRRRKRSRPPQDEPPEAIDDSATSEPLAQQQPALEATPQPQKRRRQATTTEHYSPNAGSRSNHHQDQQNNGGDTRDKTQGQRPPR